MKKFFLLLLIVCMYSFTTFEATIVVSGKITNTENGIITIKGELINKEIKLKPDGSFSENITLQADGLYKIETTKNSIPIYLSKDSKLTLAADDANLKSTLKFTGKGSVENQYLAKKQLITSAISNEELYKVDENVFLKKLQEIKNSVNALYLKTKFTDSNFKTKEAQNIHFLEQKYLFFYKSFHFYYAGMSEFKVSETYPKLDETIDFDNEAAFLFSTDYQELVTYKFYENMKTDGSGPPKDQIAAIKALKSQSLKNKLIENATYDINLDNINYDKAYHEYLSITNDPLIKQTLTANYNKANTLQPGNPSPKFDYENQKGGKTSLENLKGKYIYIDLWATWCGPCRAEIPFLQKVEEQYKGKNIEFVSISIDAIKDQPIWSKFVTEKQLGGIQLLAENEWESKFVKAYGVQGVPTFILIDPNGNIVAARAPRPSDPQLINLLNSLKI